VSPRPRRRGGLVLQSSPMSPHSSACRSRGRLKSPLPGSLPLAVLILTALPLTALLLLTLPVARAASGETLAETFECGYLDPDVWLAEVRAAVARGEIPDPRTRSIPPIAPGRPHTASLGTPTLTAADIFPFEDTNGVFLTNYSTGQLLNLLVAAANDVMAIHGDNYQFIGFWTNFNPHHTIGTAAYAGMMNDVTGIGLAISNRGDSLGLGGEQVEGFIIMWNINSSTWQPGAGPEAEFTRLALGQEYEHRFAMFLPNLLDGRPLQGDDASCGRVFHWNWKVDGQGSAMEISEWVGSNPAVLEGSFVNFNTDNGGLFGYTDLYLMGYVSAAEMDAGNSELRYMNGSNCSSNYFGAISTFASADVIAAAGPRVPDSDNEDRDYRTAWVMIHRPGDPPSQAELDKAIGILQQHMADWNASTLGRGTMDNSLQILTGVEDGRRDATASWGPSVLVEPNPITSGATLTFSLAEPARVLLAIHDSAGRQIVRLLEGERPAGLHAVFWDGRDGGGARIPPGVYFARVATDRAIQASKLQIVR